MLQALWSISANNMFCWVRTATTAAVQHVLTIDTSSNSAGEIVIIAVAGAAKVGSTSIRSLGKQENQLITAI